MSVCAGSGLVCGVVCAGCCDVLAPSPPTCPEVKGFRGCLHGDGEEPRRKILLGILFPLNPGSINQVLGEKGIMLPVNSTDITWNNSQTLPGQWERALSPLCQDPRMVRTVRRVHWQVESPFFFFFPNELKQLRGSRQRERRRRMKERTAEEEGLVDLE